RLGTPAGRSAAGPLGGPSRGCAAAFSADEHDATRAGIATRALGRRPLAYLEVVDLRRIEIAHRRRYAGAVAARKNPSVGHIEHVTRERQRDALTTRRNGGWM